MKSFAKIGFLSVLLVAAILTRSRIFAANPVTQPLAAIVPQPARLQWLKGTCTLNADTTIVCSNPAAQDEAEMLASWLRPATGFPLHISATGTGGIRLNLVPAMLTTSSSEGYTLIVADGAVEITASTTAGLFYGGQTLRQLLPTAIFADSQQSGVDWQIPCCRIEDEPRFAWRGFMLDSSRHFQPAEDIKRWLDLLAMHKLNVFHWHLVDDHGWRFESKRFPLLTQVGAWREQPPIGRYGGFYTQQEMRDVVAYAARRHITVVPEIEMPGHSRAALAAYPNLSCGGTKTVIDHFFDFPMGATVFPSVPGNNVLCAGKEETYRFVEGVLAEVLDIFPSKYIHVGGDEVNMGCWNHCADCQAVMKTNHLANGHQLQASFMARIENFLIAHGRKLIGWDEILENGLSPCATVMSWRGTAGGTQAAKTGHDAVMSPEKPLYFDHRQSASPLHPPGFGGGIETLKEVYAYDPVPKALTAEQAKHILGAQANLWTCATETEERLQLFAFPRLCALAEVAWSSSASKDYDQFQNRLAEHCHRLNVMGINYWRDPSMSQPITVRTFAPERPLPAIRATTPDTQNRDHAIYDWAARHQQVLDQFKTAKPEIVMIGDSISHYWAGSPAASIARAPAAWKQAFGDRAVANLGFGGDRTENVLWRIGHGELDGIDPKLVVVLIGTNNLELDTPDQVVAGIDAICRRIHAKLPAARLVVLGILPRKDQANLKGDLDKVNFRLQTHLHPRKYVRVLDLGNKFRNSDGTQNETLFSSDGLHPNSDGYAVLGASMAELCKISGN